MTHQPASPGVLNVPSDPLAQPCVSTSIIWSTQETQFIVETHLELRSLPLPLQPYHLLFVSPCSSLHCTVVQYSNVECKVVKYSKVDTISVQYSTDDCAILQHCTVNCTTVHYSSVDCTAVHYSTVNCIVVHYNNVRYCSSLQ